MLNNPILRIELDGLKHSTYHAMAGASDEINAELKRQLDAYLTTENIGALIAKEIARVVPNAISRAIEHYFRYGDGATQLEENIVDMLSGNNGEESE